MQWVSNHTGFSFFEGGLDPVFGTPLGNNIFNANSCNNAIVGGRQNCIGGTASTYPSIFSFIGGGLCNCIDSGIIAGSASCYGVIGGGMNNVINAGTCYSSIVGGQNNIVAHNWATVAGYGLTTAADYTFHANCLNACDTWVFPGGAGPIPYGTIFVCNGVYTGPGTVYPLFIRL